MNEIEEQRNRITLLEKKLEDLGITEVNTVSPFIEGMGQANIITGGKGKAVGPMPIVISEGEWRSTIQRLREGSHSGVGEPLNNGIRSAADDARDQANITKKQMQGYDYNPKLIYRTDLTDRPLNPDEDRGSTSGDTSGPPNTPRQGTLTMHFEDEYTLKKFISQNSNLRMVEQPTRDNTLHCLVARFYINDYTTLTVN